MQAVAEVVPPKGDVEMTHITTVKATPLYERGQVTLSVDVTGEYERNGIDLVEVLPSLEGYSVEGTILVVDIQFTQGDKKLRRWAATKAFKHSADYVVLTCRGIVLAVRPVEKVEAPRDFAIGPIVIIPSQGSAEDIRGVIKELTE